MSEQNIIRAWKDAQYRQSLSEHEQALLPAHPAGAIELHASELERVHRGADQAAFFGSESDRSTCPTGTQPVQADKKGRFLSDSIILCCC